MSPLSAGKRNIRGIGLPSCGLGVNVPTSINPNPKAPSSSNKTASLSNPAASPIGFGNFKPIHSTGFNVFPTNNLTKLLRPGNLNDAFINEKIK